MLYGRTGVRYSPEEAAGGPHSPGGGPAASRLARRHAHSARPAYRHAQGTKHRVLQSFSSILEIY